MKGELSEALLATLVADIADDLPRLVFADHLDESGLAERAEFIRVQFERARLPAWDAEQVPLKLREAELLAEHGETWLAAMPKIPGVRWEGFRRSIVAEVSFASYEAMRDGAHLCRAVAPIEAVTVRWPRRREAKKDVPPIAELREINLTGRPGSETEIERLAGSPQLATLRALTARALWPEGLGRLVASPHLVGLNALRLPENNLGNDGILELVRSASLVALEELDLSGRGVSERYADDPIVRAPGMESLAAWPGLATVRSLDLSQNEFGRVGLRTLLRSPNAASLRTLSLRGARLDGQAMAEFADARPGLSLESLDLGANLLKDLGAEYVALAPCLRELKSLRLDRCEVTSHGARLFAKKAKSLEGLRVLESGYNYFGVGGLTALLGRAAPHLHTLGLCDNGLGDAGAKLLADSPAADNLRELDLSRNGIRDGVYSLGETTHLRDLLILRMKGNAIAPSAVPVFADSPLARRLGLLEVDGL